MSLQRRPASTAQTRYVLGDGPVNRTQDYPLVEGEFQPKVPSLLCANQNNANYERHDDKLGDISIASHAVSRWR